MPRLAVFGYAAESDRWEDGSGRRLEINEVIAVRCRTVE